MTLTDPQRTLQEEYKNKPIRTQRIGELMQSVIGKGKGLDVLEIGGRKNPMHQFFPEAKSYHNMDLYYNDGICIKGDITNCPEVPSESFDVILSVDVLEHVYAPWKAGAEIRRLIKPGGITFHSTLFAWRYHPCPKDYFRFTPDGLRMIFSEFVEIFSEFDSTERRRNVVGNGSNRIEEDAFGGWRENWRVNFAGRAGVVPPIEPNT